MRTVLSALAVLFLSAAIVHAEDKKENPMAPELPIQATLVAKTTTYKLDLGDMKAEEFKRLLKEAEENGKAPPPPAIEMKLELKNTSDKDVDVWISGTPVAIDLELKGPGAVTIKPRLLRPAIFINPKPVTIAAGKTYSIPVTSLKSGSHGDTNWAYWTETGDYTLSASFKTAISPAPKDVKDVKDGFGVVSITTEPIKIKIESK
jgi:hypothetical protein